jgi:hypothetical protein
MDHDNELLNEIYRNAELSKDIIGRLIKICKDASFRCVMASQFAEYHAILLEAEERIVGRGEAPDAYNMILRRPIYCGMYINLKIDSTSSHLAEMLVQGSAMALIEIARAQNQYDEAEKSTRALAERLRTAEEANIRQPLSFV